MYSAMRRSFEGSIALTIVVLALFLAATGTVSPVVIAQAAALKPPVCQTAEIKMTAGATVTNTSFPVRTSTGLHQSPAYEEIPLYFYNRGAVCHLESDAPFIEAVRNTKSITELSQISAQDSSSPTAAYGTGRHVVEHHQKIEALIVVTKPVGSFFMGCDPSTASGVTVQYAKPSGTFHFVVRRLRDVCFDTGVGSRVLDFGAVWPAT
jgi:hypothetical protein